MLGEAWEFLSGAGQLRCQLPGAAPHRTSIWHARLAEVFLEHKARRLWPGCHDKSSLKSPTGTGVAAMAFVQAGMPDRAQGRTGRGFKYTMVPYNSTACDTEDTSQKTSAVSMKVVDYQVSAHLSMDQNSNRCDEGSNDVMGNKLAAVM